VRQTVFVVSQMGRVFGVKAEKQYPYFESTYKLREIAFGTISPSHLSLYFHFSPVESTL
jgi:hypothetical protein